MTIVSLSKFKEDKEQESLSDRKKTADKELEDNGFCVEPNKEWPRWYLSLNQKALNIMELTDVDPDKFMSKHKQKILSLIKQVEEEFWKKKETTDESFIKKTLVLEVNTLSNGQCIKYKADAFMYQWKDTLGNFGEVDKIGYSLRCDIKVSLTGFKYNHPKQWYSENELV